MSDGGDIFGGAFVIIILLFVPSVVLYWGFSKTKKMNLDREYEDSVSWPKNISIAFGIIWIVYFVALIGGDMVDPEPASISFYGVDHHQLEQTKHSAHQNQDGDSDNIVWTLNRHYG